MPMNKVAKIRGPISVLRRSDVDTDQIIPKQFLKRVERTGFGEFLFYDWAKEPGWDLDPNPILVTGRNFGCGSSREHAPWALEDFGFKAVIAPSFADIFYSNCTKVGLLPVYIPEEEVNAIMDGATGAEVEIDLEAQVVRLDRKSTRLNSSHANISYAVFCLKNKTEHGTHEVINTVKNQKTYVSTPLNPIFLLPANFLQN